MLLRSLRAVNFGHFREISIPELPESGLVLVRGGGRDDLATVRDLLCFAFYGRSATGSTDRGLLIRPGARYAWVGVGFQCEETGPASILRGVDRQGTEKVSLREAGPQAIRNRSEEVEERIREIFGTDVTGFCETFLPETVPPTGPAAETVEGSIDELKRDRKRVSSRLRRARRRRAELEKRKLPDARREAERLRGMLASLEGGESRDPGAVPGKSEELRRAEDRLRRDLEEEEEEIRRLRAAWERTAARRRRLVEYAARLRELRSLLLSLGTEVDRDFVDGRELRRIEADLRVGDRDREARRALVVGIGLLFSGLLMLILFYALTGILDRSRLAGKLVFGALGLLVLIDFWFTMRSVQAWQLARTAGPTPSVPGGDPLQVLASIEEDFPDLVETYEPGLARREKAELRRLEAELRVHERRRRRLRDAAVQPGLVEGAGGDGDEGAAGEEREEIPSLVEEGDALRAEIEARRATLSTERERERERIRAQLAAVEKVIDDGRAVREREERAEEELGEIRARIERLRCRAAPRDRAAGRSGPPRCLVMWAGDAGPGDMDGLPARGNVVQVVLLAPEGAGTPEHAELEASVVRDEDGGIRLLVPDGTSPAGSIGGPERPRA